MPSDLTLSVSEFVGLFNQTLEYAYPSVLIHGELANFRVSKGLWVYFDLKDQESSLRFFGSVYDLPGPLEDGLLLLVRGKPRLHPQYGFSVNFSFIQPAGDGSLKRAAALLEAKLRGEGLFDELRKRSLAYPPTRIGLITSSESAAYADFVKVLNERWGGVSIELVDVQVQGEAAVGQIIEALTYFNQLAEPPEVLVITRGGGSAEDLATFSTEQVTRAVAASRVPTLAAIGHEVDISLAELAADKRASTPSNAAQLLVPQRTEIYQRLSHSQHKLGALLNERLLTARHSLQIAAERLHLSALQLVTNARQTLRLKQHLLNALNPLAVLKRGFAIVRHQAKVVRTGQGLRPDDKIAIQFSDVTVGAVVRKRE